MVFILKKKIQEKKETLSAVLPLFKMSILQVIFSINYIFGHITD